MNEGAANVHPLADVPTVQNSVRLFEQLHAQGYADDDLRRSRTACATAQRLFTGRMHFSGKQFLSHCIGTAGALAALGAPIDLVVAGLAYDGYRGGDFGPWRSLRLLRRQLLRRTLGARAEEFVARCASLNRDALVDEEPPRDQIDRGVALIRLAAELDDLRDRNVLDSADAESRREATRLRGPKAVAAARALGYPALASALAAAIEETLAGAVASELCSRVGRTPVFPPESATPRFESVVIDALAGPRAP